MLSLLFLCYGSHDLLEILVSLYFFFLIFFDKPVDQLFVAQVDLLDLKPSLSLLLLPKHILVKDLELMAELLNDLVILLSKVDCIREQEFIDFDECLVAFLNL